MGVQKKLDTYEELQEDIYKYDSILPKNIIQYLESLLNLEVPALRQDNIDSQQFSALSELRMFKMLLYYNICNRSLTYIDNNDIKYITDKYWKGFSITYGSIIDSIPLINISRNDNDNITVSLNNIEEPSFKEIVECYDSKILSLEEGITDFRRRVRGKNARSNLEDVYERLSDYTLLDIEKIYLQQLEFNKKQKEVYNKFIIDNDLFYTADFVQDGDSLSYQEDCIKVFVKTKNKTPIFR